MQGIPERRQTIHLLLSLDHTLEEGFQRPFEVLYSLHIKSVELNLHQFGHSIEFRFGVNGLALSLAGAQSVRLTHLGKIESGDMIWQ